MQSHNAQFRAKLNMPFKYWLSFQQEHDKVIMNTHFAQYYSYRMQCSAAHSMHNVFWCGESFSTGDLALAEENTTCQNTNSATLAFTSKLQSSLIIKRT
jgi:hypothetical protein